MLLRVREAYVCEIISTIRDIMASIDQYTVAISDNELEILTQKLSAASFPDELDDASWGYGAPLADIRRLTQYWKGQFDWRREEAKINNLPNFRTTVEVDGFGTLDIHFLHQKSNVKKAIPLLFSHGCTMLCFRLVLYCIHVMQGLGISSRSPSCFRY